MSQMDEHTDVNWRGFTAKYAGGSELDVSVVSIVPFGAFVEVSPGVHGLLHMSEWTAEPAVGDELRVRILQIDDQRRRVAVTQQV